MEFGLNNFEKLKPWYVKWPQEFNSCCCQHHVQMLELKDVFNAMWRGQVHRGCICGCIICKLIKRADCDSASSIIFGVKTMCELILYPKSETKKFHKLGCIKGYYNNCGISKLQFYLREMDPNNEMLDPWKRFENVYVGQSDDGGDRHVTWLQCKMTPPYEFVAYIKPKLTKFVVHNFKAKWQDVEFKSCLDNLTKDQIVIIINFANNYFFKEQNKIQSQHWFSW